MRGIGKSERTTRVADALALVQLGGYENRYPRELSGGQQQRVALARALVFRPPVLLVDEPLGALDRNLRKEMQFELKVLQGKLGITVLYVTHDQEEALTLSHRIAVMRNGRIEQVADAETLYERPANSFVASFVGDINLFPGEIIQQSGLLFLKADGGPTIPIDGGQSCRAIPSDPGCPSREDPFGVFSKCGRGDNRCDGPRGAVPRRCLVLCV